MAANRKAAMCKRRISSFLVCCLALLAAALPAGIALTGPAVAQTQPPKQFLLGIYKQYTGKDARGLDRVGRDKASRYFDDALTDLIVRDQDESEGEFGRLGFDPFVNGQDFEIRDVGITVSPEEGDRVRATASFVNFGRRQRVFYDLVRTEKGWRISNISWPGTKETLLSIMSGPRL